MKLSDIPSFRLWIIGSLFTKRILLTRSKIQYPTFNRLANENTKNTKIFSERLDFFFFRKDENLIWLRFPITFYRNTKKYLPCSPSCFKYQLTTSWYITSLLVKTVSILRIVKYTYCISVNMYESSLKRWFFFILVRLRLSQVGDSYKAQIWAMTIALCRHISKLTTQTPYTGTSVSQYLCHNNCDRIWK